MALDDLHRKLCLVGERFLKRPNSANGHGCHFALVEPSGYGENPDVIGFRHGCSSDCGTVLLEVKVSRSDFLRDKTKPHRINPASGIGRWRYYVCPTGLIKPNELPPKWGLIYVNEREHCKVIAGALAVPFETTEQFGRKMKVRSYVAVDESYKAHAFDERNVQNEINILVMALARLDKPEDILYMQRNFMRIQNELMTLRSEHEATVRKLGAIERRAMHYKQKADKEKMIHDMLNVKGYRIVCGRDDCLFHNPELSVWGEEIKCLCGWTADLEPKIIREYAEKWEFQ